MDEHLMRFDKTKELVFIDFETENLCLYLSRNLPWQAAMLKVKGDKVLDTFDQYFKWDRPLNVSPGAAIATHFDAAKVERLAVPHKGIVESIVDWTSNADFVIGHNILGFDIYFLISFYEICGKSSIGLPGKIIDTHPLAKGIKLNDPYDSKKSSLLEYQYRMIHTIAKGVKTNTLTLGTEYGIQHDYANLHNALVDLQLLIKIWNHMKFLVEI